MKLRNFDVIIVGGGVGGLICGNYLAKHGLEVLMIEKHWQVGGLCTSFKRKDYYFDVGVHYIGSVLNGVMERILGELGLKNKISFNVVDPSDKIITPKFNFYLRSSRVQTKLELLKTFPNESVNIEKFFDFIFNSSVIKLYSKTYKLTFIELINLFFKDKRISLIFNILFANIGINVYSASALAGIILCKSYLFDSGCYPIGGMQSFSNTLRQNFVTNGGELLLSHEVEKILIKDGLCLGVVVNSKVFHSRHVVSNADAYHTFNDLIDEETFEKIAIRNLRCSPSLFVTYLGLNTKGENVFSEKCNIWYAKESVSRNIFLNDRRAIEGKKMKFVMCSSPSLHTNRKNKTSKVSLGLFTLCPFLDQKFFEHNKKNIVNQMINLLEEALGRSIRKYIEIVEVATPHTFKKYTNNQKGAAYGWAADMKNINKGLLNNETSIQNLYLTGHWATGKIWQGGIPGVAFTGRTVAEKILGKKVWKFRKIN